MLLRNSFLVLICCLLSKVGTGSTYENILQLIQKADSPKEQCDLLLKYHISNRSDADKVITTFIDSTLFTSNSCSKVIEGRVKYLMAKNLSERGLYKDAIEKAEQALTLFGDSPEENIHNRADSWMLIGYVQRYNGAYPQSISNLQVAMNLYEQINNQKGVANTYLNIGTVQHEIHEYEEAIKSYKKSEAIYTDIKLENIKEYIYNNIGSIYLVEKKYTKAIEQFKLAEEYAKANANHVMNITIVTNIAYALFESGKLEESYNAAQIAEELSIEYDNIRMLNYNRILKSKIALKKNDNLFSIDTLLSIKDFASSVDDKNLLLTVLEAIHNTYDKQKDYANSYKYLKLYQVFNDSLKSEEIARKTSNLSAKYELENLDKALEVSKVKATALKRLQLTVTSLLSLLLITLAFFLRKQYLKNKQLEQSNLLLINAENEVRQQRLDLITINNQLTEYIETNIQLEHFSYNVSHDLKSPLRTISSFAGLLSKRLSKKLDAREKEYITYITNGVKRMYDLIDDLLRLSDTKSKNLSLERIDTIQFVKDVINDVNYSSEYMQISIGELPQTIQADRIKLRRVFQNLIENAIKYRNNYVNSVIKISSRQVNGHTEFSIQDNGIGIAPQNLELVFTAFNRIDQQNNIQGSGLGLSICKNLIEIHGGKIWVKSVLGVGSNFIFTIPNNLAKKSPNESENEVSGHAKLEQQVLQSQTF